MAFDPGQLNAAVSDPVNAAMSDAELSGKLSAPILTPKPARVTATSLGSVWGVNRAAGFMESLEQMKAAGGATGALASYTIALLNGPGFDASDPSTAPTAGQFVAAGLATQAEVNGVLYDTLYACGDVVSEADVTTARASVALVTDRRALSERLSSGYNTAVAQLDEGQRAGKLPQWADLIATIGAAS